MRLLDLGLSVQGKLRELPYPAYLLAMSVIVKRLAEIYADVLPEEGRLLAARTADAAKTAYLSGAPARTTRGGSNSAGHSSSEIPTTQVTPSTGRWGCSAPDQRRPAHTPGTRRWLMADWQQGLVGLTCRLRRLHAQLSFEHGRARVKGTQRACPVATRCGAGSAGGTRPRAAGRERVAVRRT
jgi:hypothetical protein